MDYIRTRILRAHLDLEGRDCLGAYPVVDQRVPESFSKILDSMLQRLIDHPLLIDLDHSLDLVVHRIQIVQVLLFLELLLHELVRRRHPS